MRGLRKRWEAERRGRLMLLFLSNICIWVLPNKHKTGRLLHWASNQSLFLCPATPTATASWTYWIGPHGAQPPDSRDWARGDLQHLIQIFMIKMTKKFTHKQISLADCQQPCLSCSDAWDHRITIWGLILKILSQKSYKLQWKILPVSGLTVLSPCNSSYTESNKRKLFFLTRPRQVKPHKAQKEIRKMEVYSQSSLILPWLKPTQEMPSVWTSQIPTGASSQPPTTYISATPPTQAKGVINQGPLHRNPTKPNRAIKHSVEMWQKKSILLPQCKLAALPVRAALLKLLL